MDSGMKPMFCIQIVDFLTCHVFQFLPQCLVNLSVMPVVG